MGQEKAQRLDGQYCLHVHSKRKRLADTDGISIKYFVDSLVTAGILPDDRHQFIKEIKFTQEKVKTDEDEETIFKFYL